MDNILQYVKTQIIEPEIQEEEINVYHLIREKLDIYFELARANNTELLNLTDPGDKIRGNRVLLSVIIHNLIDNAIKVTNGGQVRISFRSTRVGHELIVQDSGIGMTTEQLTWINESTNNEHINSLSGYRNTGLGFIIIRDLAAILNLGLRAAEEDGMTAFYLSFTGNGNPTS